MLILFLIVFIDLVGFGLIIPLLPFYGEHFAATPAEVGLLMASFSLAQFVAAPVWGRLSDRIGRRPVLLASLGGATLAYLGLALAQELWMLFVARTAAGLMAGNLAAAFAYIADITTPANRAKGMGVVGAAFGLGFIFGPAIGGFLAGHDPHHADYATPSLAAAGFSAAALVLAAVRLPESLPAEIRARNALLPAASRWRMMRDALGKPVAAHIILISFLATFVFAGMETVFAMWSRRQLGWGPEQNGYLFAFVGLISAGIQGGLIGRASRRFGEVPLTIAGAAALTAGMLMIPCAHSLLLLLPAMVIVAGGFSLMSPTLSTLLSLQVSAGIQGGAMGVSRSAATLARVLGPMWAGALFAALGKEWPFYAGAAVMALVVALCVRLHREIAGRPPPAPPH